MIESDISVEQSMIEPHRKWALDPKYSDENVYKREFHAKYPKCGQGMLIDRVSYIVASTPRMYEALEVERELFLLKNGGDFFITKDEAVANDGEKKICVCGKVCKNAAGHSAHIRQCSKYKEYQDAEKEKAA